MNFFRSRGRNFGFFYYLLSFISGITITTQVAINGELSYNIKSQLLTSLISFSVSY
ncbi:MAG: DMT family transporter, partial [Ruminiclostridium sp.]